MAEDPISISIKTVLMVFGKKTFILKIKNSKME